MLGTVPKVGGAVLDLELQVDQGLVERVRVDMGEPILESKEIPCTFDQSPVVSQPIQVAGQSFDATCVSMGNPHCILFVPEATDELVHGVGPQIEHHARFPSRVNVEFVEVISRTELKQRTWERGSGETLACGTGASAVCVAGVLNQLTERRVVIHLLGGDLELEWDEASNHVFMTGPATEVYSGVWPLAGSNS